MKDQKIDDQPSNQEKLLEDYGSSRTRKIKEEEGR